MKMFVNTLEKTRAASTIYENPSEIPTIRKNQVWVLRSVRLGKIG